MQNIFTARTLEECLQLASQKLNLEKQEIDYEILEERQGLFIKKVTISVKPLKNNKKNNEENIEIENKQENSENIDGTVMIKKGKIVVKNPIKKGKAASIIPNNNVTVLVDGVEVINKKEVYEDNVIEVLFEENTAQRVLNIETSNSGMEAYVTVKYIPENIYELNDTEEKHKLKITPVLKEQKYPKPYTIDEIKEIFLSKGIKVGIIKESLYKLTQLKDVEELLVAKGIKPINGVDDKININFETNSAKKFKEDKNGNVDYKSIGIVKEVKVGEVLATIEKGIEGKDGIDIRGVVKKHVPGKKVKLKIGQGCKFKDANTVVSTIEGKPSLKGGVICVNKVHHIEKDVDITTGNVDFVGDVLIYGNVKEGMKVNSGQNLTVNRNVEHAKIYSKQDMDILGNVINSELYAGGNNISKLKKLNILEKLNSGINELISTVEHIKKFNLLGKKVRDGEILKVLLENKFKYIDALCVEFSETLIETDNDEEKLLSNFINKKLIGVGPLSIKNVKELHLLTIRIKKAIDYIKNSLSMPVTMSVSYCQDSILKSSGNIVITGKGEYVSEIISHENVEFIASGSIARGGTIKAEKEIKCKEVGSEGGVSTKLIVGPKGHIWVDVAYQNTRFIVGEQEYVLETPSKEIHAYLGDNGEITVDKFVL
ncbi:hypothetical protein Z969_00295 [Clostridium novyi A str. 4570]|uniref:RNA-binding protein KhpB N-terminal domain-containing protein n=1 Tax=Clostridium novyi A str. 4570 TaxID=1444290 RepID=A0AA88ZXJ7_CLONO|nr:flagellar assembly protein A [Clostridium novyi]KGN03446.1 hypothetical protein Z969_00295 [Clostridium novyi A str. 4570]